MQVTANDQLNLWVLTQDGGKRPCIFQRDGIHMTYAGGEWGVVHHHQGWDVLGLMELLRQPS
jgi:hypothetical protein